MEACTQLGMDRKMTGKGEVFPFGLNGTISLKSKIILFTTLLASKYRFTPTLYIL